MSQPFLSVASLRKVFEGGAVAVDGVSFGVAQGKILTLLGPSGCGKTTTLRCIAGLETPTAGTISIDGEAVTSIERGLMLPPERRNIGMVFQSYAVWPHMTVAQNLALPLEVRRVPREEIRRRVAETLDLVGLAGLQERYANRLSGGQQQRVALARALITTRACCSSTSRSATSTPSCASGCATRSVACSARSASPRSTLPTTRPRR